MLKMQENALSDPSDCRFPLFSPRCARQSNSNIPQPCIIYVPELVLLARVQPTHVKLHYLGSRGD